ncbi:MAG: DNA repair protein RadA, partial [Alphaproteobacteria bacterium]|nr:DNA repair protein RadA [Alphaproteobacteria bacterium]
MAKAQKSYVCQACGAVSTRWAGKCDACQEWNTITEEAAAASVPKGLSGSKKGRVIDFVDLRASEQTDYARLVTKIGEFDRVTGGGLVPGSAL